MTQKIPALTLIFATDENNVIGKNNDLPWRSPHDLKWFQFQTVNHSVIMGRKTWESLPKPMRPLQGRDNYVITSNADYSAPGAEVMTSLQQAINHCREKNNTGAIFVIGGKAVLEEAAPFAAKAIVSRIGRRTPIDENCVMAPTLPEHTVEEIIEVFDGDDKYPSVKVEVLRFK